MKLQHLRTFIAVYQHGSFTSAAERVYATQSGVSMQMKELEEDLGVQLFERSARGIAATIAGERFYRHAVELLKHMDAARQDIDALKGQPVGSVTVGLMPTFARAALAPAIAQFTAGHPLVRIRVIEAYSAVLTERVAAEELDFAIVPLSAAPDSRVHAQHLARDRELFVTSVRTTRSHLAPVLLGAAGPLKLILPVSGNARRNRLDEYVKTVGATVEAVIEMDAMMGTLELVAASDWVAILPATLCQPDIGGGPRKVHPLIEPALFVDYVLITPVVRTASVAAAAFAQLLIRQIRLIGEDWSRHLSADPGC